MAIDINSLSNEELEALTNEVDTLSEEQAIELRDGLEVDETETPSFDGVESLEPDTEIDPSLVSSPEVEPTIPTLDETQEEQEVVPKQTEVKELSTNKQEVLTGLLDEGLNEEEIAESGEEIEKAKETKTTLQNFVLSDVDRTKQRGLDLKSLYENVYTKYSTFPKQIISPVADLMGFKNFRGEVEKDISDLNAATIKYLEDRGFEIAKTEDADDLSIIVDGKTILLEQDLFQDILDGLYNSKGEIGGALVGATAGIAAIKTLRKSPVVKKLIKNMIKFVPHPVARLGLGATYLGIEAMSSGIGSGLGRGVDLKLNLNTLELKEELEGFYSEKMIEAGVYDFIYSAPLILAVDKIIKPFASKIARFATDNLESPITRMMRVQRAPDEDIKRFIKEAKHNRLVLEENSVSDLEYITSKYLSKESNVDLEKQALQRSEKLAGEKMIEITSRAKDLSTKVTAVGNLEDSPLSKTGLAVLTDLEAQKVGVRDLFRSIVNSGSTLSNISIPNYKYDAKKLGITPKLFELINDMPEKNSKLKALFRVAQTPNVTKVGESEGLFKMFVDRLIFLSVLTLNIIRK